jgi:hypothetical protein
MAFMGAQWDFWLFWWSVAYLVHLPGFFTRGQK